MKLDDTDSLMPEQKPTTIPFPREGFRGIEALIELGKERLTSLAEIQKDQPLDLSFSTLCHQLAGQLECEEQMLRLAFTQALVPLNGLRRNLELPLPSFLASLSYTVESRASDEWKEAHLAAWQEVVEAISPLLEPDNYFAQASKAFDLLTEHSSILQNTRILTELRPIYDESTTKTLATLQTNTLALNYWDGESVKTLHLMLDRSDLDSLEREITRAKAKIDISQKEASAAGANLVVYGDVEKGED